nr:4-hydroxy-tetrahydrodipicolinate reductase [Gammaproteobacteria bacterium]
MPVAVFGISGRMGRALIEAIEESGDTVLAGACASAQSPWRGRSVQELGARSRVLVAAGPEGALEGASVAIDFSLPEATLGNVRACVVRGLPMVIGTTGHASDTLAAIEQASKTVPIVMAPNMSLGVNLLLKLVELTARLLDEAYDIEVFEAHHRNKKDAPSGTALALGRAAARGRGASLEELAEHDRHGSHVPRRKGAIGFSVFRGGDVVGDHTVTFAGIGERIELTHRASDRLAFARGAIRAAHWLVGQRPGLYSMQDVLGLGTLAW